ncbi:hypothetical protein [Novosphingobium terrae]|uniref:hypothetical protein n=1 Tax=Novosphingobium terrae TaxID=2726189 RepID=UPI00197EE670|nr:hypothetical protein [Novosphingobium terrae]
MIEALRLLRTVQTTRRFSLGVRTGGGFARFLPTMDHLYIVEIGGTRQDCLFESHLVHALVAPDERSMIERCRETFTHQLQAAHIDGWVALPVERDDPFQPLPTLQCYLVELGRNSTAFLREQHDYRFVAASDGREAITQIRAEMPGWHVDTVVNIDRLALDRGWRLRRDGPDGLPQRHQVARYLRFDRMTAP